MEIIDLQIIINPRNENILQLYNDPSLYNIRVMTSYLTSSKCRLQTKTDI